MSSKQSSTLRTQILFATLVGLPGFVSAQVQVSTPSSVQNLSNLGDIIQRVFNTAVGVSGIIFVLLLLFGGVLYLTSLGNEDGVTKARKTMVNAAIGLAIVVSSWAIGNFTLRLLGIQVSLTGSGISSQGTSTPPILNTGGTGGIQQPASQTPSTTGTGTQAPTTTTPTTQSPSSVPTGDANTQAPLPTQNATSPFPQ